MKLSPELRLSFDGLVLAIAAAEMGPSPADLAEAPVIDLWRPLMFGPRTVVLWGLVSGHPEISRDYTTTSALIALDRERGWARTWNRWYRLAAPLPGLFPDASGNPTSLRFTDFELPGFEVIEDPDRLPELLADYIARARAVDARDRAARQVAEAAG
ncbi:DUF6634 family protein [Pseudogemmobacter bohemicus]|uniref:DUF6634 family protein n=1 Tax=Pseudogemmobacter bohemicus TaxID=2250708 RepID=UPI000DD498EF|nr:DUF6634 family protein [Pseudogemmobacter bohemicus]